MEASLETAKRSESHTLLTGRRLRCPRCGGTADVLDYFVFPRAERYAHELNPVYKCRARVSLPGGGHERCRAVFSPSEPSGEVEL